MRINGPLGAVQSRLGTIDNPRGPRVVKLTSDVSGASDATSTTIANITGLSFAVAALEEWEIEVWVIYTTAAATTGFMLTANGPASSSVFTGEVNGSSGASTNQIRMFAAYDGGSAFGNSTQPGNNFVSAKFTLRNGSNAGTFQLRFASEVASSQVIVKAGSFVKFRRLP